MLQLAMATALPAFGRIWAAFHTHGWMLCSTNMMLSLSLVAVGQGSLTPPAPLGVQPEGALALKRTPGPLLRLGWAASCWLCFCIVGVSPCFELRRLHSIAKYQNSFSFINLIRKNTFYAAYLVCEYSPGLILEMQQQR